MRSVFHAALAVSFCAAVPQAQAVAQTHYLELVNRAQDSIVSLSVAPAGSDAFQDKPIDAPLLGGGGATTIAIAGAGCVYDLRFVFRGGRAAVYEHVDVCRDRSVRIRSVPKRPG